MLVFFKDKLTKRRRLTVVPCSIHSIKIESPYCWHSTALARRWAVVWLLTVFLVRCRRVMQWWHLSPPARGSPASGHFMNGDTPSHSYQRQAIQDKNKISFTTLSLGSALKSLTQSSILWCSWKSILQIWARACCFHLLNYTILFP